MCVMYVELFMANGIISINQFRDIIV